MRRTTSKGRKAKFNTTNKPLLDALYKSGYVRDTICKHLGLSSRNWLVYFTQTDLLTLNHLKRISYLLNRPLNEVINLALEYKPNCVQWVNESVNHINIDKTH